MPDSQRMALGGSMNLEKAKEILNTHRTSKSADAKETKGFISGYNAGLKQAAEITHAAINGDEPHTEVDEEIEKLIIQPGQKS